MKAEQGHAVPHGPSIIETLNGLLDEAYDDLVKARYGRGKAEDRSSGIVAGLAMAIAIMINPYEPNEDAVMAEAIERRKARQ